MKRWVEFRQKLTSDKKLLALLGVFLAGLVLLAASSGASRVKTASADPQKTREKLERSLEQRAEKLLSTVQGVGKVRVMVTVDLTEEYRYAKNTSGSADGRNEGEYVIVEQQGDKTGLALASVAPTVRGVAVSCTGGGSARVRQEVVNLMCAAFGVGASRVYVTALGD